MSSMPLRSSQALRRLLMRPLVLPAAEVRDSPIISGISLRRTMVQFLLSTSAKSMLSSSSVVRSGLSITRGTVTVSP